MDSKRVSSELRSLFNDGLFLRDANIGLGAPLRQRLKADAIKMLLLGRAGGISQKELAEYITATIEVAAVLVASTVHLDKTGVATALMAQLLEDIVAHTASAVVKAKEMAASRHPAEENYSEMH